MILRLLSSIEFSGSAEDPEAVIRDLINVELSDAAIGAHLEVDQGQKTAGVQPESELKQLEEIRNSFQFRLSNRNQRNQYKVAVSFRGDGRALDQLITTKVTRAIADRLNTQQTIQIAEQKIDQQWMRVRETIESGAQTMQGKLEEADQLVNSLNADLSDVHDAVSSIRPASLSEDDLQIVKQDRSKFKILLTELQQKINQISESEDEQELWELGQSMAKIKTQIAQLNLPGLDENSSKSVRIINASLPDKDTAVSLVLDMLDSLDVDSIQTRIGQLQNNLMFNSVQLREEVTELRSLASELLQSQFVVNEVSETTTRPTRTINAGPIHLVFGFLAVVLGLTTTGFFRPELECVGFSNLEKAELTLKSPVLAAIENGERDQIVNRKPLANSVVRLSETVLFGFVLLILVLCFIDSDLRDSFLNSPLYGLTRLTRMFI